MDQTDNDLMLAAKNGDAERFGILFDRYHQRLFEFFYRLGSDTASSQDLVQEVFLRMLKYRNTFRPDSEFRAWMYGIARTVRIDRFRSQRVETSLTSDDVAVSGARKDSSDSPFHHVEYQERAALLHRALLRLPEEKRELLILARYQELQYEQIGTLLGVDVGIVKVRIHRAMVQLRETLRKMSVESATCVVKKPGK